MSLTGRSWIDFPMDAQSWRLLALKHQRLAREERKCRKGLPHDRSACDRCVPGISCALPDVLRTAIMEKVA